MLQSVHISLFQVADCRQKWQEFGTRGGRRSSTHLLSLGRCRTAQQCEHQMAVLLYYSRGQLASFRAQHFSVFESEDIASVCEPVTTQAVPSELRCGWLLYCCCRIEKFHYFTCLKEEIMGRERYFMKKDTVPSSKFESLSRCVWVSLCMCVTV